MLSRAFQVTLIFASEHEVLFNFSDVRSKKMTECFREAATSLGNASLKPEQVKMFFLSFFEGKDVLYLSPQDLAKVFATLH